ncbi:MAG TPA: energy transducer TonB [Terracidiphilus sp.]|jgi:protein TonB
MFEDSTFDSTGRIRTRSRGWMIAALAFNSSIVLTLVLAPLIYPQALPSQAIAFLMAVPPPPASAPPAPLHPVARAASESSTAIQNPFQAPRAIPDRIAMVSDPGPVPSSSIGAMDTGTGIPGGITNAFQPQSAPRVVHPTLAGPVRISSGVAASIAIKQALPLYPAIAVEARIQGTVVLAATISKTGTVDDLRVVSGPPLLRQAALNAVSQWRYRPYLLNGEPVAVETTVNVVFNLQR